MTLPVWSPFAILTVLTLVVAPPAWVRRVDWPKVAVWVAPWAIMGTLAVLAWWLS